MTKNKRELELYVHIPFCIKKCAYCDFPSSAQSADKREEYVEALIREIRAYAACESPLSDSTVTTIFVGGGTPSILLPDQIERIFAALRGAFQIAKDAEITIEANPGTVTEDKLKTYLQCKINRISFGLQSADCEELKMLGRIHTYEEFLESYRLARACGFRNINVDLMSAIPKQTLQSWENTLRKVLSLNPEHISAYSLIVEDGTPFAMQYGEGCPKEGDLPGEEEERIIYHRTKELLSEAGYHRYEISNYAKAGKECRHNLGYWERKEYLGLGLSASSLIDHTRYKNTDDPEEYISLADWPDKIQKDRTRLTVYEQMEEFLFLGLRKTDGISEAAFADTFGKPMEAYYEAQLARFLKEGLLERSGGMIRLTERGIDVSNYVFAEFLHERNPMN